MESPCFSRPQSTASHLFARTRSFHRPTYKRPGCAQLFTRGLRAILDPRALVAVCPAQKRRALGRECPRAQSSSYACEMTGFHPDVFFVTRRYFFLYDRFTGYKKSNQNQRGRVLPFAFALTCYKIYFLYSSL